MSAYSFQGISRELINAAIGRLMNEFLYHPVWTCEEETGIPTDALPLIRENPVAASLNREIGELFDSHYELDSHDLPYWFNKENEKG